ncbi:GPR endopeptidase . Aspartic peptidase. MEROPS family A25 [Lentibacillus halodurans]|uniref:Germination protease n=1 Tax=Lentibacillus halodurans TaxID=237679 RepID=A0A1I0V145_9BACI|nr:GPR endopeptidase [Lentibacillus halodurans]SFA70038.1 GPR endopeptidase . Aspartic peptidase. MEROPS family A25 [Lentibacillus halodurans]
MADKEKQYEVRTDLAVEAKDMYVEKEEAPKQDVNGVTIKEKQEDDIAITYVDINAEGEQRIGKKQGSYITIYADGVKKQDTKKQEAAAKVFGKELEQLLEKNEVPEDGTGLIVGLGNWNVTPDALGPMSVEKVLVTSHLFQMEHESVSEGYRPVAAVTPGVMGVTGMETSNIIFGIVEKFNPDFVIAVDALASRSIERVNETIQISDTGIHPGSGVGNKRKELSEDTIGVPVLAVGCPTVVDAVTITSDTIDFMLKHFGREWRDKDKPSKSLAPAGLSFGHKELKEEDLPDEEKRKTFLGIVGNLSEAEKKSLIQEVLTPIGHNLMVTPKEVDGFMKDMATVIATGLNTALHDKVTVENFASYTR